MGWGLGGWWYVVVGFGVVFVGEEFVYFLLEEFVVFGVYYV